MKEDCLNCDSKVTSKYCPDCGQKVDLKYRYQSVWFLILSGIKELFLIDNKFFKTFGTLLFKPGKLTKEYMNGKLGTYLNPITLFLLAVIFSLFFTVNPLANNLDGFRRNSTFFDGMVETKLQATGFDLKYFEGIYDERTNSWSKTSYLILIIIFGSLFSLLFWKKKRLVHHLVFWLHYISAISLVLLPIIFEFLVLEDVTLPGGSKLSGEALPFFVLGILYLTIALNKAYEIKPIFSFLISLPIFILYFAGLVLCQSINFYLTVLSM